MRKRITNVLACAAVVALIWMAPQIAEAGRTLTVTMTLAEACANCDVVPDVPDPTYSVLQDFGPYQPGNGVKSEIINHNTIYNLDTLNTLVNGNVGSGTRYVRMHFFSPVEGQFPGHNLPACWNGNRDQNQAVNWIILSDNSQTLTGMTVGTHISYPGRARMDFNVRNASCEGQIFRYYLNWYNVCIKRTATASWEVTSDPCGATVNYGTANLRGQGGRRKETVNYGDFRLPFKMTFSQ